jgi:hypothetical protein
MKRTNKNLERRVANLIRGIAIRDRPGKIFGHSGNFVTKER